MNSPPSAIVHYPADRVRVLREALAKAVKDAELLEETKKEKVKYVRFGS